LPIELGFLASFGCPVETLHLAAALACVMGVSADQVVLKHGLVPEDVFYRALAAELGLTFSSAPRLSREARFPQSLWAGVAPLEGSDTRFVMAPEGPQLRRMLHERRPLGSHLVLTSPGRLRRAVFAARRREIAQGASHQLSERDPNLTSRLGITEPQVVLLSSVATALVLFIALLPGPTISLLTAGLSPLFFGMVLLRLSAALASDPATPPGRARRQPDADLPVYSVIVALHRERRVVRKLVEGLASLDYPLAKLDIKLVVEEDDRDTRDALLTLNLPAYMEILVAPPGEPRTKPRALNVALPLARGEFTVIYDAEDVPDPDQLRLAVSHFARHPPEVACLQAHLWIENADDTWLTRLFAIEYASLFDVLNPGLAALNCPIPLGGTSNHFRTAVLRAICGWDAWNVTEDADLGIRLARFGYRVADLPSSTREEATLTLGPWMKQRTRWMKGFVQTCLTHSRRPLVALRELGPVRFWAAVTMTFGTVLSALVYPVFTILSVLAFGQGPLAGNDAFAAIWRVGSTLLFVLGLVAIFVPALIGVHRRRQGWLLPWLLLLPLYYALVSMAAWRCLWELLRHPYRWNKTEHGLSLASRRRSVRSSSEYRAPPPLAAGSGSPFRSAGRPHP
jgi:cellulose synthase/poly-beta-1,6-N-acetylglucosamine synthase-like glycosyltransferase